MCVFLLENIILFLLKGNTHRKQVFVGRMCAGVGYIRQCIVWQEFRCLTQRGSGVLQENLEVVHPIFSVLQREDAHLVSTTNKQAVQPESARTGNKFLPKFGISAQVMPTWIQGRTMRIEHTCLENPNSIIGAMSTVHFAPAHQRGIALRA